MNDPRQPAHPTTAHPVAHPPHPAPAHPPLQQQGQHPQQPQHGMQATPGGMARPLTGNVGGAVPVANSIPRPPAGAPVGRPIGAAGVGAVPVARPISAPAHAPGQMPAAAPQGLPRHAAGSVINPAPHNAVDDEPVALVEDADEDDLSPVQTSTVSKIKQFSSDLGVKKHTWKRQPATQGNAPVRVKTFHAKLSDQGLEYLDEAVNVFIDEHPEVDIKFVTTNIGMFDGKFKDLALIVNVWY